jgi:hypothetical protein
VLHKSRTVVNFQETQFAPNIGLNIGSGSSLVQRRRTTKALLEDQTPYCKGTCFNTSCIGVTTYQHLLFFSPKDEYSVMEYYVSLIENVGALSMILMVIQFTTIVLILRQR